MRIGAALGLGIFLAAAGVRGDEEPRQNPEPPVLVVDPGHGGPDDGARGPNGLLEKDLVLSVGRRIGAELERAGLRVVYTRTGDRFVALSERGEIANRARGELFLSIHANASPDRGAIGVETFFLSTDASDEEALRVAQIENAAVLQAALLPGAETVVGDILQDLAWTSYLEGSSHLAGEIQRRLAHLPGPSRGVKQAPFVVLMGVNMPAVLIEIGFLTNPGEAKRLLRESYQGTIARSVARSVQAYLEASRGESP